MKELSCEQFRDWISENQGRAPEVRDHAEAAHMRACPECQAWLQQEQRMRALFQNWLPAAPPAASLWQQILERIQPQAQIARQARRQTWMRRMAWGGSVAAAMAMVAFLVNLYLNPPLPITPLTTWDPKITLAYQENLQKEADAECPTPGTHEAHVKPEKHETNVTSADEAMFRNFVPPVMYGATLVYKIDCPCGCGGELLYRFYTNSEHRFLFMVSPENCPLAMKIPSDGNCHFVAVDGGIFMAYLHPCGRMVAVLGDVPKREAVQYLMERPQ
ncbi:MAG: hypothetical protein KIT45_10020 [Fimbriimonadia bacterium]|nr:hypothetical protein [Fimbriimonadia bacterium]